MIYCFFLSLQANLENQKKQQGNAITEMFDRLKTENESRKHEIHGLKDILVREHDNRIQETEELRMAMELGTQQLVEAIEKEKNDSKKRIKAVESSIDEEMKKDKKELIGKIETVEADIKKKVEMEANETR